MRRHTQILARKHLHGRRLHVPLHLQRLHFYSKHVRGQQAAVADVLRGRHRSAVLLEGCLQNPDVTFHGLATFEELSSFFLCLTLCMTDSAFRHTKKVCEGGRRFKRAALANKLWRLKAPCLHFGRLRKRCTHRDVAFFFTLMFVCSPQHRIKRAQGHAQGQAQQKQRCAVTLCTVCACRARACSCYVRVLLVRLLEQCTCTHSRVASRQKPHIT